MSDVSRRVRDEVLREAGYRCANPRCMMPLTLDVHHVVSLADSGSDDPANLVALCPNCHQAYHRLNVISIEAIRYWKQMLLALNHAFSREAMDLLLFLRRTSRTRIYYSGDGLVRFASLMAAGLAKTGGGSSTTGAPPAHAASSGYEIKLTKKGEMLLDAWLDGDADTYRKALESLSPDL